MTIRPTQSELALLFVHIRNVAAVTPYCARVDIERLRELLRAKRDERVTRLLRLVDYPDGRIRHVRL